MVLFLYMSNLVLSIGIMTTANDAPTWVYIVCLLMSNALFVIADLMYDKDIKNKNT